MMLLPDYRVRQRDYLLEISRAMTAQLDLGEVLVRILEAAGSMLAGQVGLIALLDDDDQMTFRTRATIGVPLETVPLFESLLENILDDTGEGLNLELLERKMRQVARSLDMRLRQVIALPLVMLGDVVGVIFVFRAYSGETTLNDQLVLQSFADQAAIAVHNARLYQHVKEEQLRLAAILDHSADGVMILDASGAILRFNKALARISGFSPDEAIGKSHDEIITWKRVDQGEKLNIALDHGWPHMRPADAPPDTLYVEGDLIRSDSSHISIGITYAPLMDEHGSLKNIIANVRDITNFRQAQELKSTFVSVVSHELKTPVALIKGYASTLRRDDANWDPSVIQQGLEVIEEEADRLTELIENLLAASKLQAEGMRLTTISDVDLAHLARRAVERFRTQTRIHKLSVEFPPDFPSVQGDETRLRQVIDNLISNAIKYSPKGGAITIRGTFDDQSVTLSVSDQGVGLPPDEQARIFERFYRVEDTLSRKTQGTGLGLYLSRAVAEAHGGTISVSSEPAHGSTFTFSIPREQSDNR